MTCPICNGEGEIYNPAHVAWEEREDRRSRWEESRASSPSIRWPKGWLKREEDPEPKEFIQCPECEGEEMLPEPGIYPNLSMPEYRAIDAVCQTDLKEILRSPAHMMVNRLDNSTTDSREFGTLLHTAILEPDKYDPIVCPTKTRNSKAYDSIRDENPDALIILESEIEKIAAMKFMFWTNDECRKMINEARNLELSMVWEDAETGILCKGRPDLVGPGYIMDLKTTTNASNMAFGRDAAKFGYHIQAAFYLDGIRAVDGVVDEFRIVAIEKEPPYGLGIFRVPNPFVDAGREEYRKGLEVYNACVEAGSFPGYPEYIQNLNFGGRRDD